MDAALRQTRAAELINAVDWLRYQGPVGERVDLAEPLTLMAADTRPESAARYYGSDVGVHLCNQGSMGELTLPAVRLVIRLLEERLCAKPELMYELLAMLTSAWTEIEVTDPATGQPVVLWEAVFRELFGAKDVALRDFAECVPTESPALLDLLVLLAQKYPDVIAAMKDRADSCEGAEQTFLREKLEEVFEAIEEDQDDHDYRLDVNP